VSTAKLEAALELAQHGIAIVPCHWVTTEGRCSCGDTRFERSAGKHPCVGGAWQRAATTSVAALEAWWTARPQANVGLATGPQSDLLVVDLDVSDGVDGRQTFASWQLEAGASLRTVRVLTPSGGEHVYLRHVADLRNAVKIARGVDIRTTGGLAIAPGSVHRSGGMYAFAQGSSPQDVPIARAPEWLVRRLTAAPKPVAPVRSCPASSSSAGDVHNAYARAEAFAAKYSPAVSGAGGHDRAFALAVVLTRGFSLTEHQALEIFRSTYNPRCSEAWNEDEMQHKIHDARKHGEMPFGAMLLRDSFYEYEALVAEGISRGRHPKWAPCEFKRRHRHYPPFAWNVLLEVAA
jgi:hypothetical protein